MITTGLSYRERIGLLVERKLNDEIERWLERALERQEVLRFSG